MLNETNLNVEEPVRTSDILGDISVLSPGDRPIDRFEINGTDLVGVDENGTLVALEDFNYSDTASIDARVRAHSESGWSGWSALHIDILQKFYEGTAGDDRLQGSGRDEFFYGRDGNDHIEAGAGDDTLEGGNGDDTLLGGEGEDRLIGGQGNDTLQGGPGDDTYLYTKGDGNDTIEDSGGEDRLILKGIETNATRFVLTEEHHLKLVFEDNSSVTIQNWGNNDYKIESMVFDDQEVTLEAFEKPIVRPDGAVVDLSKLGNANAAKVVQGFIRPLGNGYNKVDHWVFNFDGGDLIIDTLSELNDNGHSYIDIDGDGHQLGVDIYIYLFKKDGDGNWQTIAYDDDSDQTYSDGSSHRFDSYLRRSLDAGEYLLAVGNFSLGASAALSGRNSAQGYPGGGAYQITFNQPLDFIEIPEGSNGDLYGSDHFNFYTLRNDIDAYGIDGLHIENPEFIDANGSISDDAFGTLEAHESFISYYPGDRYSDLNDSKEVNVVYDVVNDNTGEACRSLLTLHLIPSMYVHTTADVNRSVWQNLEGRCVYDLNITKE